MRGQHLLLIVAGVMIFAAGVLIARSLTGAPPPVAPARPVAVETRSVLVARADMANGRFIQVGDLEWQERPVTMLRPELFVQGTDNPASLAGAVLLTPKRQGEPITRTEIVSPENQGFLAAVLPPGKRSVSIAVDEVTGSPGLIFAGDRVDVILTMTLSNTGTQTPARGTVGQVILRNARVLAVDRTMSGPGAARAEFGAQPSNPDSRPAAQQDVRAARTVTLEVESRDAERLSVAVSLGRLSLALRSLQQDPEDKNVAPGAPVWAGDVIGALGALGPHEAKPAAAQPAPAARPSVTVLRGGAN